MPGPTVVTRPLGVILLALCLAPAAPSAAQTTTAVVQGVARDASRALLPGVTVTLRDESTGFVRSTATDQAGAYALSYVPAGTYDLTMSLSGFKTVKHEGLRFEVGQEATIDVTLDLAPIAESVTVREQAPLVETTKTALDKVITREQIDNLPLSGRQATSLAMLAPGVVPRNDTQEPVTAGGQPRGSSEALVDGVSSEGMALNSVRANAPPDAIREFQVLTTQYAAEFGNATSVILNTITRSGTNDLHGRVYYFHRDEKLDAKNAFATSKASFEQKQPGGWLGGPIARDRTHYFVAYEGTRRVTVKTVASPLQTGDVKAPFDNNQLLAKVTHQLTPNNTLTGRFSLDRPFQHNEGVGGIYLEEVGYDNKTEDRSFVANLASILSSRALNELRVQIARTNSTASTRNPDEYAVQRPTSMSGKLPNMPQAFPERRVQFVENLTYEAGPHRIKVGADINRVSLSGYVYQYNPGYFVFATDAPFNPAVPATYPILFYRNEGSPNFSYTATGAAAFAQDAWRLPGHLTLNLGVRYDGWTMDGLDLKKANFAPRLGFAWDPTGSNKTSVRGGYGVFYGSTMFNIALLANWLSTQRIAIYASPGYPDPFSRGIPAGAVVSTYESQPDEPLPRAHNTTAGIQHEIRPGLSVSADYVNARGRDLVRIVETNPVLANFSRANPSQGSVRMLQSSGYSNYNALLVSATERVGRASLGLAYTLSRYKTTTDSEATANYQFDATPDDAYGYGNFDQRHRVVANGTLDLPARFQIGAILVARSGTPFNITTGKDNNKNAVLTDRPDLAPSARVGTDDMLNRASFVDPGARGGTLPRNAGRGPAMWQLDARLAKSFQVSRSRAELMVEAFNLTNHTNLNNPISNLASPSFGRSITAADARQVQLGFRFEF